LGQTSDYSVESDAGVQRIIDLPKNTKITLSTTTHGNGERLDFLKRNIESLDNQIYQNWVQYIVIDHSPPEVVAKIVELVKKSKYPHRRRVIALSGWRPTGMWGKYSHTVAILKCKTELFAFYCDDNFYAPNHLADLIAKQAEQDYDITFSFGVSTRNKNYFVLRRFCLGGIDLGQPIFHIKCFDNIMCLPSNSVNNYDWDWHMINRIAVSGASIGWVGKTTFFFGKNIKETAWQKVVEVWKDYSPTQSQITELERDLEKYPRTGLIRPRKEDKNENEDESEG